MSCIIMAYLREIKTVDIYLQKGDNNGKDTFIHKESNRKLS